MMFFLLDIHAICQFIVGVRHCELGGWNPRQLRTSSVQIVKRHGERSVNLTDGSNAGGGGAPANHFIQIRAHVAKLYG